MTHVNQAYTFGPFRLDPTEGRLTMNGEPVRVAPKALALLAVLVSRAGYLVTNQELIADAWPNAPADEHALATTMAALRAALDDERGDTYIETIPNIGYRFNAPIARSGVDAVWADPSGALEPGWRDSSSIAWAAAGVLLLAAAIGAAIYWGTMSVGPRAPVSSVLVVPFNTVGASAEQAYLGLGMADALAMRLGGVEQLRVPPTAAVQSGEDAFNAGLRLGVDAVITGSIQRDGGRVRVAAQLSRVRDRAQLWNAKFDGDFTSIFSVQDAIAERIATSVLRSVNAAERNALRRRETNNVDAYDLYLRGRERWSRRTVDATRAAIELYKEAIEIDPSFAEAYAGLADAYLGNASGLSPAERFPLAHAAVDRALELNPKLADAWVARGYLLYRADWKFAESEAALERAIALDGRNNLAHHHLGQVYKLLDRLPESLAEFTRAHELDPHHPRTYIDLVIVLLYLGRLADARAIVDDGVRHVPDHAELHEALASVLEAEGHHDDAMEERLKARLMTGVTVDDVERLRDAYRRGGLEEELRQENAQLLARFPDERPNSARGLATALAQNFARLRDRDETIRWLERSFDRREEGPLSMNLPDYDFLRDDPRFVALHDKVFGATKAGG